MRKTESENEITTSTNNPIKVPIPPANSNASTDEPSAQTSAEVSNKVSTKTSPAFSDPADDEATDSLMHSAENFVSDLADTLLSQQIAHRLRTLIATDDLKPGERLRERTLAERLQVSRTPLREALKELAGDGLVIVLPKRGAVVANLSAQQIGEKLDVLGVIEAFGGEQCCKLAHDHEIAEIRALHHEMHAAYERRDRITYFHLNQAIHTSIVMCARNETLQQMHEQLNRQLYRYRYQGSVTSETWVTAIHEHDEIITLLSARNGPELGAFLRRHVHSTWEQLSSRR